MTHFVAISQSDPRLQTDESSGLRDGKFVQIRDSSDEYLVFAPRGMCKYHSNIVEQFAEFRDIEIRRNKTGETVYFADPNWEIVGGGKMRINTAEKSIEIGGVSQAYGPFDGVGLRTRLAEVLEGFVIAVLS